MPHNKTAIHADDFNQSQAFIFDLLHTAGLRQGGQHTTSDTIMPAQNFTGFVFGSVLYANNSILSVLLRGLHHSVQVVRISLIYLSPARKNKTAAGSANLDEFSAILLYFLGTSGDHQR